ncbi:MAG: hypothetical protein K6G65_10945 [Lachnospiraceae bacterium]|nr:hypothetical protein [Lachnospiraceae bacterium]
MGKKEKAYICSLIEDVNTYCDEENISDIEHLYKIYGTPSEVVTTYYSMSDTSELIKKIQVFKWIQRSFALLLVIFTLVTSLYAYTLYQKKAISAREDALLMETNDD